MNEREIFIQAARLTDPSEQAAFLSNACGTDEFLRLRLVDLLSAHARAQSFLEAPPSALAVESNPTTVQPPRELPGTLIGPYKLLQQIGEGGMGVVYMAEQSQPVQRRVALKIIKPGMDTRQVIARFEAERQALALMDHPSIAKVLDAGTTEAGRPYFVMELVKGVPITRYCDEKRLSLRERLELMIPVCQAIQHAHQKGIIHRDIKPTNVLIAQYDGKPVPKVIDFGVAKATAQKLTERTMFTELGQVVGTLEYMSPEQAELNQLDIDTRSDVYSLGVLLYELLTGSTPFDKQKLRSFAFHEMLRIIREEEPPKPSTKLSSSGTLPSIAANRHTEPARLSQAVHGELDWIVMKALEKDRSRRYETANGFAADVQRYLDDEPVQACPPTASYRFRKFARRNKATLTTAAVVAAMLILGTTVSTWQAFRATQAEAQARANETRALNEQQRALAAAQAEKRAKLAEIQERQRAEKGEQQAKDAAAQAAKAEATAKQSAAEATAVFDFFQDKVLAAGRPEGQNGGLGKDVTLRRAVDAAEPAVAAAFKDNPLVEVRVPGTLAQTYHDLGEPQLTLKQALRSLELNKANLPPGSESILQAMGNVGTGYLDTGKPDQALQVLEEAFNLAKSKLGSESRTTRFCMAVLATAYGKAGKIDRAVQLSEERLRIERNLDPEHPQTLVAMNNLAVAYSNAGKPEQAIKILEELVTLDQAKLGPKHRETLTALRNLGTHYLDAGKIDQALPLFHELVKTSTALLGQQHPQTLNAMTKLGRTYLQAGQIDLALPLLEQAYVRTRTKLGPDHSETLWTMGILASALKTRTPDEALRLCREAFDLAKAKYGADHPSTLNSMNNLALALIGAGRPIEALPLMEELSKLDKAKLGLEHPDTLIEMENLAVIYDALGEFNQAVVLSQELLKLKQAKLGEDHRSTLRTMHHLGAFYVHMGKAKEAVETLEVALRHQRAKLGPEHPESLDTLSDLAVSYELAGNSELGLSMMQDALKLGTTVLGNENRLTLRSQSSLARMYGSRGEFARADALFRESLPRLQSILPPEHPWTLQTTAMFALNLLHQAKYGEAEPLLRACLATNEKIRPDRWETFNAKSLLGGCLLGQSQALQASDASAARQKLVEAEPLLLTGYEGLKTRAAKIPANESIRRTEALQRHVELYTAWDKPDQAAKWQAELDARTAEQPK